MFVGVDGRHRVNGEAERNNHRIQLVLLQLGTAFAQRLRCVLEIIVGASSWPDCTVSA
jgi:hypothetical protein